MSSEEKYNTHIPFEFRGDGKSYFRIWVVNFFLSLITLGIYSAWAKVRSNRYFYSHLYLDGNSFEYVANPFSILLGRVVAVILFIAYSFGSRYLPELSMWFLIALIPVFPWVIFKSLKFRARNSLFRNIRFGFHGTYLKALLVIGVYPAMAISPFVIWSYFLGDQVEQNPTLVLSGMFAAYLLSFALAGFVLHQFYAFVINNSSYGTTRFTFSSSVKEYFQLLLKLFFSTFGVMFLVGIATAIFGWSLYTFFGEALATDLTITFGIIFSMVLYVWIISMYAAGTTNRLYNGLLIPAWYTFRSDVTTTGLFKVYLINTLLILITLGMYIPFAKIRLINYRVEHLKFVSTQSLDKFVFDSDEEVSAMGQEMGEIFDLGLSL